ncbi:hypothetical protein J2X69_003632 [Algoriphagus sp. 4150]|uniref:hypothetical protein n=1 Tax=Algoriphagus sp. 4150 TaxID=2817756 RepID=UPI0028673954|nr:hypothetical protein [Algoriphagus sp. 4150]MDR7131271.1 hypothetical protein [Algoriphagus sp. 4150]
MKTELNVSIDDLIEELIMADMKHSQLTDGLEALDLCTENHYLGIYDLLLKIFKVERCVGVDDFTVTYLYFMDKASDFPITHLGEELRPLAKECYQALVELAKELKEGKNE